MTWFSGQRRPDPWCHELARLVSNSVLERVLPYVQPPHLSDGQEEECAAILDPTRLTPPAIVATGPGEAPTGPARFCLDALFLEDSFHHLSAWILPRPGQASRPRFRESLHYATGVYLAPERLGLVSHLVALDFAQQSAGGVLVADDSNARALEFLDRRGLSLLLHVHTHPGAGLAATTPSETDLKFQERLERGGHICIGGIFDRSGSFIRFFAGAGKEFSVVIQGRGVKEVKPHVFQLSLDNGHF
jgi:hypothetical protein